MPQATRVILCALGSESCRDAAFDIAVAIGFDAKAHVQRHVARSARPARTEGTPERVAPQPCCNATMRASAEIERTKVVALWLDRYFSTTGIITGTREASMMKTKTERGADSGTAEVIISSDARNPVVDRWLPATRTCRLGLRLIATG